MTTWSKCRWVLFGALSACLHAAAIALWGIQVPWALLDPPEFIEVAGVPYAPPEEPEQLPEQEPEATPQEEQEEPASDEERGRPMAEEEQGEIAAGDDPEGEHTEEAEPEPEPDTEPEAEQPEPEPEEDPQTPPSPLELPEGIGQGDLSDAMAGGSVVSILVRTKQIAASPHKNIMRETIRRVPGFKAYLGQEAFDPIDDFQWLTLRSPNPRSLTATILEAELTLDEPAAREKVSKIPGAEAGSIEWMQTKGNSGQEVGRLKAKTNKNPHPLSWAIVADEGPLLLAGPDQWVTKAAADGDLRREYGLEALEKIRVEGQVPGLVVAAHNLSKMMRFSGSAPAPQSLILAACFAEESVVITQLFFEQEAHAEQFTKSMQASINRLGRFFLPFVQRLELRAEGTHVVAKAPLTPAQLRFLLGLVNRQLSGPESPQSPNDAAPPPRQGQPDAPETPRQGQPDTPETSARGQPDAPETPEPGGAEPTEPPAATPSQPDRPTIVDAVSPGP